MTLFEPGRLCIKLAGREAGKLCVVVNKVDSSYVLVSGPRVLTGVRRRKCNVEHLEPLQAKIKVKTDAADSELFELLKKENDVLKKLKIEVPSEAEIKKREEQRAAKAALKKEAEKKAAVEAGSKAETKAEAKPIQEKPAKPEASKPKVDKPKKTEKKA